MKVIQRKKIKKVNWLFISILLMSLVWACSFDFTSGDQQGGDKYFEISLEAPQTTGRLINVTEYAITGMQIIVTDPAGEIIQIINWNAAEGSQLYQIPVIRMGEHSVRVIHISRENGEEMRAEESATFNIQPMIITRVDIIPGCMGFISIDAETQNAVRIVRNDLVPALLAESDSSRYALTRMSVPLARGSVISEARPQGSEPGEEYVVAEDTYMFLMDLEPGAYFGHPVKYILVGEDGSTTTYDADWWPRVDGESKDSLVKLEIDSPLLVDRNVAVSRTTLAVSDFVVDASIWGDLVRIMREAFVVVQGLMLGEPCYTDATNTYNNGMNFFNAYKSSFSNVTGLYEGTAQNVLTTIDQLANDGYNPISIYIIAHGDEDSISLSGIDFFASQFATTMSNNSGTSFNFLLGSCHGGSFVDDLQAVANVRVVKTATNTALSAYPDWDTAGGLTDYNPLDTGSEWTSSILYAADAIVNDPDLWDIIVDRASDNGVHRTSVLLNEAGWLALGVERSMGVPVLLNYDLSDRDNASDPQHYCSWELILFPIEPIIPELIIIEP